MHKKGPSSSSLWPWLSRLLTHWGSPELGPPSAQFLVAVRCSGGSRQRGFGRGEGRSTSQRRHMAVGLVVWTIERGSLSSPDMVEVDKFESAEVACSNCRKRPAQSEQVLTSWTLAPWRSERRVSCTSALPAPSPPQLCDWAGNPGAGSPSRCPPANAARRLGGNLRRLA